MNVNILVVGMLCENCYVIQPDQSKKDVIIIDPGDEGQKIIDFINEMEYEPKMILQTHAHLDHIKATKALTDHFGIEVYCHEDDIPLFLSEENTLPPYLVRDVDFPQPKPLSQMPNDFSLEVRHTPGHTPGGVCFYFPENEVVFTGDTLFKGAIGRTDLPGGDTRSLLKSINDQLMPLPDNTVVYPGHGEESTILDESLHNPYLNNGAFF